MLTNPAKYRALAANCTMLFVDIGGCRELPTVRSVNSCVCVCADGLR